ncbi:Metallo-dependent phosphatase-like protein [Absidia repens]|uniref:Metallo-dependent phosphatase-like protein n=1 Tax=Absidia repens TaxID=90262 RepID=A0A1X2IIJ8_9FUNG|nr:Metallo-dependent phosphatase-like protein [Absidia repens]
MFWSIWKGRSLHQKRMVTVWRLIWVIMLLLGEWFVFSFSVAKCRWPATSSSSSSSLDAQYPQRLLLIADPQVTDAYSYDRTGFLLWWTEFYSDLYMRRSYRHLTSSKNPDKIVFMGDLMDGGREWGEQGWKTQLKRFYRNFNKHASIPTLYMSGNHDIGIRDGIKPEVFQRFQAQFGPTSLIHPLAYNHTLVVLDTAALTNTNRDTKMMIQQEALDVMNEMMMANQGQEKTGLRVLLSHVPLYRPEQTSCGPLRVQSRPFIYQRYGYQYQNMMNADVSHAILQSIQPDLVFSGDDHDFCEVTHAYYTPSNNNNVGGQQQQLALEYTVPTFSMSQGVRTPGYMLLQATQDKLVPQLCWLPDQLGIFIDYGLLAGLTLLSFFGRYLLQCYYGPSVDKKRTMMKRNKKEDEEQQVDNFVIGGTELMGSGSPPTTSTPTHLSSFSKTASHSSSIWACLHDIKDVAVVAFPFYIVCILFM